VHGTCEECIRRFPDDDGAYLVLARGRLANFYRDLIAQDGLEAVRCLQEVIRLDAANIKAHRLLGEVLYRVGALDMARPHLEILRDAAPDDGDIEEMYQRTISTATSGRDVEEIFLEIEENSVLPNGPVNRRVVEHASTAMENGIGSIRDALGNLAEIEGVRKAAYIRGSKALVKGEIRDGRDPFLRVSRVVAKAAPRPSRRMDIGNFSKGVVDGDFGHICICNYGEVVASVLCDQGADVEHVLGELQDLVAGSLYLTGAGSE
jgi:predicted regulator of Ras-like GTPase activity (Roadblock/LC7/MglB family)